MASWVKLLPVTRMFYSVLVQVPTSPLMMHLLVNGMGSIWAPARQVGDLGEASGFGLAKPGCYGHLGA